MVAASSMATRSSLELMLDKLQQLEQHHSDIPPPLPVRPVSKARRARLPRPKLMKKQDFHQGAGAGAIAETDAHFLKKESGNLKEREKGICKIQKWYRGHRVRCCYRELTRGVVSLQSFIRGENARRGYEQRCRILSAIIIIQKQGRKYLEHAHSQSGSIDHMHPNQINRQREAENTEDQTRVPYTSLVDLQKRVVRTEAKLRAEKEENAALKRKLLEIEKKWQQREERMASMEKEWQDQLTFIQERLAAAKKNPSPEIRCSSRFQTPDNRGRLHIPRNSNNNNNNNNNNDSGVDEEGEVGVKVRPSEELRKVRLRFKKWKKEYKNKLRDAQLSLKKLGNTETSKSHNHKNWWGRLSN